MGIDDARDFVWQSPFDFATQGLLCVPEGIGEPSGPDFADRVFRASWPLVHANRGRAFLLCTTLRMVEQLASRLRDAIEAEAPEIGLLVQGSASRAELLERFRRHPAPVLVGSASFWEGVDVPGRQLSLVIIDKLPFAPPDEPILRARIDAARRAGEVPFRTMQLPAAAMALKQGAGRLLRSERDRGLLVVCDARLAEKSYRAVLLRSLPPFRRTRSLEEAMAFVEAIDADSAEPLPGAASVGRADGVSARLATSRDPPASGRG
jgi:ATP-dependent DNA helicase DinG